MFWDSEPMFPREVLNRIKWTDNPELEGVEVWYLHRGAPGDIKMVEGREIIRLEHSYFVLRTRGKETRIPYHRIRKITCRDEVVYDRADYR